MATPPLYFICSPKQGVRWAAKGCCGESQSPDAGGMPLVTIDFDDQIAWGGATNNSSNCPYCEFRLHYDTTSNGRDIWGLLDMGADYLTLDTSWATQYGIVLGSVTSMDLASGASVSMHEAKVDITIQGKRVTVDALFGSISTPLIGRTAILRALDFGIDINGWLYRAV